MYKYDFCAKGLKIVLMELHVTKTVLLQAFDTLITQK